MNQPRVALVHDWLTGMRGGEKVLEVLCTLYPSADLFTLVHVPHSVSPTIERLRPKTSALQHVPGIARVYRHLLPIYPLAIEQFDLDGYDLVISTSHCAAKSVVKAGRARHLCYCFTPMRYAWDQFDAYFGRERMGAGTQWFFKPILRSLARWDAATAGRPDRYVAISQYVATRIRRYYNRDAAVIYPPVDTDFYSPDATEPERFLLVVSALVPYKRIDLAIDVAQRLGVPLRIVGGGPERERLEAHARTSGADVTFLGAIPDEDVRAIYRRAAVMLLPGEEDFGIAPVEAQACGRPVVALGRGGARETVVDGVTGVLVEEGTVDAFARGIQRAMDTRFDSAVIRAHALKFDTKIFARSISDAIAHA